MEIALDDLVGAGVGEGNVAIHLVVHFSFGEEGEGLDLLIAGLAFQPVKVHAAAVDPGRGAGLEPAQRNTGGPQALGELVGGVLAVRTGGIAGLSHKDAASQIGAGGDDHGLGAVEGPQPGDNAGDAAVFHGDVGDLGLLKFQIFAAFQEMFHVFVVALAVGLHPQGMDRRAFAQIEHPALEKGGVGGHGHDAPQSVDLPHQMTLGGATDGGVTGQVGHPVQGKGKQGGFGSQLGGGMGCLDAGMACADHHHFIIAQMVHSGTPSFFCGALPRTPPPFEKGGRKLFTCRRRIWKRLRLPRRRWPPRR